MSEAARLFEEKIKSEEIKKHLLYLETPYSAIKALAIRELNRLKYDDANIMMKHLSDSDENVRAEAYRFLKTRTDTLGEEQKRNILLKEFDDYSPKLRKEAIKIIIQNNYTDENIKQKALKDTNGSVRYEFLKNYVEMYPEEREETIELFREDPYVYIQKFITGVKDIRSILLSFASPKIKTDALTAYKNDSSEEELYKLLNDLFFKKITKITKNIMIRFMEYLTGEHLLKLGMKIIKNEEDSEVIDRLVRMLVKNNLDKFEDYDTEEKFLRSGDPKLIKLFFYIQSKKDNMNYVVQAQELMNKNEDTIILSAGEYLLKYSDRSLTEHINSLLSSRSAKRITFAIKIIKKFELYEKNVSLAEIAKNKFYPTSIRKKALICLKKFKDKSYVFVGEEILKDTAENGTIKLEAVKMLERIDSLRLEKIYEEIEENNECELV